MKYDKEATEKLVAAYNDLISKNTPKNEVNLALSTMFSVPERSIIAKLSSMGLYKRQEYVNKQGNPPVKKEEYIERIAIIMGVNLEILESLEKCNKSVLALLEQALKSD